MALWYFCRCSCQRGPAEHVDRGGHSGLAPHSGDLLLLLRWASEHGRRGAGEMEPSRTGQGRIHGDQRGSARVRGTDVRGGSIGPDPVRRGIASCTSPHAPLAHAGSAPTQLHSRWGGGLRDPSLPPGRFHRGDVPAPPLQTWLQTSSPAHRSCHILPRTHTYIAYDFTDTSHISHTLDDVFRKNPPLFNPERSWKR